MEDAAAFVDQTRIRGLARLARAVLVAAQAATEAEAPEADAAALDEFQAALDAALEAAGTDRPGFVLQSDNTGRPSQHTHPPA